MFRLGPRIFYGAATCFLKLKMTQTRLYSAILLVHRIFYSLRWGLCPFESVLQKAMLVAFSDSLGVAGRRLVVKKVERLQGKSQQFKNP